MTLRIMGASVAAWCRDGMTIRVRTSVAEIEQEIKMSARISYVFALVLGLMMVTGGSAVVAAAENAPSSGKEAVGDGIFKYAQLGVYYDLGDGVFRSTNVKKVTNPSTGIYCIKPIKKWITTKFMGIAAVEWGDSNGNDLLAFWKDSASGCPNAKRWFEVRTYDQDMDGNWVLTDDVAWTFYVP